MVAHTTRSASVRALASAGRSNAISNPIIDTTTSSSTSVNPRHFIVKPLGWRVRPMGRDGLKLNRPGLIHLALTYRESVQPVFRDFHWRGNMLAGRGNSPVLHHCAASQAVLRRLSSNKPIALAPNSASEAGSGVLVVVGANEKLSTSSVLSGEVPPKAVAFVTSSSAVELVAV